MENNQKIFKNMKRELLLVCEAFIEEVKKPERIGWEKIVKVFEPFEKEYDDNYLPSFLWGKTGDFKQLLVFRSEVYSLIQDYSIKQRSKTCKEFYALAEQINSLSISK